MDLSSILKKENLPQCGKKLSEINSISIWKKNLTQSLSQDIGDFSFTIEANETASISLYNDPNDDNDDDLVSELKLDEYIESGQSFLKYQINGRVKGATSAGIEAIKIGFSLDKKLTFTSYIKHNSDSELCTTVLSDLKKIVSVLNKSQLLDLETGSVVTQQIKSNATFEGSVEWSDALTTGLGKISKLLNASKALEVNIQPGASIKVSCAVEDDFIVVIQRQKENEFFVNLKKAKTNTTNIQSKIGVSAQIISDDSEIDDIVDKVLDNLEEGIASEMNTLISKAENMLNEDEKDSIVRGAELLGLEVDSDDILGIKEKYEEKRKSVKETLVKVIKSKVELGVKMEYNKVKSNETLFKGYFTKDELSKYHKDILLLKINHLLQLKGGDKRTIYKSLVEVNIKKSFGIGLSIGKFEIGKKNEKTYSLSHVTSLEDGKHSFKVSNISIGKSQTKTIGKNQFENSMQLVAMMSESVSNRSEATLNKFDYQLNLLWSDTHRKTNERELKRLIDSAIVWGSISPDDYSEMYSDLKPLLVKGNLKKTEYEASISIPLGVLDQIIAEVSEFSRTELAESMAAALPFANFQGRQHMSTRRAAYNDFFYTYMNPDNELNIEAVEQLLEEDLAKKGFGELSAFEGRQSKGINTNWNGYSMLSLLKQNSGIKNDVYNFLKSLRKIANNQSTNYSKILDEKNFRKKLEGIKILDDFTFRALGRIILDLSDKLDMEEDIERSFKITYKKKSGEKEVKVFG